jgi:hypothetical protein
MSTNPVKTARTASVILLFPLLKRQMKPAELTVKFTFVYPGTTIPLVLLSRDTREKAAPKRAADLAPVFISGGFDSNPLRVGSRLFAFRDRQREHTH